MEPDSFQEAFVDGFVQVLTETFEGAQQEWSWYLDQDRNVGLLATCAGLTAAQASKPTPLGPTVVAHVEHTRFHLAASSAALRGERMELDWARSWDLPETDEAGWLDLRGRLHDEYQELKRLVTERVVWDATEVGGAIAALTHAAYHLGVVRQLLKFVRFG